MEGAMNVVDMETGQPRGKPSTNGGGNGTGLHERVARLEAEVRQLATKEDLQKVKVWFLCGVLGGMASAAVIALAFIKLFG